MTARSTLLIFAFLLFSMTTPATAAQDATITIDQAAIREHPSKDSKEIEGKPAGATIRISSESKNGWYKTRLANGRFGWIWHADLSILDTDGGGQDAHLETNAKTHERRFDSHAPWLFLRASGGLAGLIPSDINNRFGLGQSHLFPGFVGCAELAVRIEERLRLALRYAPYQNNASISFSGLPYSLKFSGSPLLLGVEADASSSAPSVKGFNASLGLYGGLTKNSLTVSSTSNSAPNSAMLENTTYAIYLDLSTTYRFLRWLAARAEAGFYFSRTPATRLSNSFNGDAPLRDPSGELSKVSVNHAGPMLLLGLQLSI